jgi:hypothetical protein
MGQLGRPRVACRDHRTAWRASHWTCGGAEANRTPDPRLAKASLHADLTARIALVRVTVLMSELHLMPASDAVSQSRWLSKWAPECHRILTQASTL